MAKIKCPECGSEEILFGRDHLTHLYWQQDSDHETYWSDFERGDLEEFDGEPVSASCQNQNCFHTWTLDGSIYDYLDG